MFDHPRKGRLEIRPPRMLSHRRRGKYSPAIGSAGVSPISCHFYPLLTPVPRSDWHYRWRQRHQTKKEIVIIRIISNFLIFLLLWLISFCSNKRSYRQVILGHPLGPVWRTLHPNPAGLRDHLAHRFSIWRWKVQVDWGRLYLLCCAFRRHHPDSLRLG